MIARRPKQVARRLRPEQAKTVARIARRERVTVKVPSTKLDLKVRHDPVAEALDVAPGKVDARYRTNHDAFITMLRAGASPHNPKFSVEGILGDWWSVAFPGRSFPPPEGGYANELALAVQYGLLMQGYVRYSMTPPERFRRNHDAAVALRFGDLSEKLQAVLDYEEKSVLGQKFIQPKGAEQCRQSSARPASAPRPKAPQASATKPKPKPKPIARRPRRKR